MFKATVVASKLREKMAYYFDQARGKNVVQILHRGGDIKVLMTQEHYLDLVSRLALYEKSENTELVSSPSAKTLEQRLMKKIKQVEEDETENDQRGMGKVGSR
ncbi:MAG: hypothetical protein NDI63_08905 [Pseudobdellovibrio sp.]|nr:hypothetical protein [Pseudobdellovibrio sp.]